MRIKNETLYIDSNDISEDGILDLNKVKKNFKYIRAEKNYRFENVKKIKLPNWIKEISGNLFSEFAHLEVIEVDEKNQTYMSKDGVLFDKSGEKLITFPRCKKEKDSKENVIHYEIPDGVTSIEISAFRCCAGLTSIIIPKSVTSIGHEAFLGCNNLQKIEILEKYIGNGTFLSSLETIGKRAFGGCTGLTSINIPESVISIGYGAFENCTGLTSINIPESVTSIGNCAFRGCTGLTSINIPESVISIGYGAFENCTGLTSINIPDSVTSIGNCAFEECTGLTSINIPDSVTSIGSYAFRGCTGLTSINIPESVTSIGNEVFYGCSNLQEIKVSEDNSNYQSADGVLFDKSGKKLIVFPECKKIENLEEKYIIPEGVTRIESFAFYGCSSLQEIEIPNSVESIGYLAFGFCSSLQKIEIPDSVKSEHCGPFYKCSSLKKVKIPQGVRYISEGAFEGCDCLECITISNTVEHISERAFAGCNSLTEVTFPEELKSIGGSAFSDCTQLSVVKFLEKKFYDKDLTNPLELIIGADAFKNCSKITEINLPSQTTKIGGSAFENCTELESVHMKKKGVKIVGNRAFADCGKLTFLLLSDSIKTIGDEAFCNCSKLVRLILPRQIESIGKRAFMNCFRYDFVKEDMIKKCAKEWRKIAVEAIRENEDEAEEIKERLKARMETGKIEIQPEEAIHIIEQQEDKECYKDYLIIGLNMDEQIAMCDPNYFELVFPENITTIGKEAFLGCKEINCIRFHKNANIDWIDDITFAECQNLEDVYLPRGLRGVSESAFEKCSPKIRIFNPKTFSFEGIKNAILHNSKKII